MSDSEKIINISKESFANLPLIGGWFKDRTRVAVLRLSGVIADDTMKKKGLSFNRLQQPMARAFSKKGIEALCLVINCPGGSPAQTSLIADTIRFYAEQYKDEYETDELPVYAFVEDVAASGGYWLACAADEIYVQPSSIVGSIGVISASFGFEEFIDRHGIKRRVQTSGKDKSFMDPFVEQKKTDVDRLKRIQKAVHKQFVDWVKLRRDVKLEGDDKTLFEGGFWTGREAVDLGLVDGEQSFNRFAHEKYGDDIQFIEISLDKKLPLMDWLGLSMMLGEKAKGSSVAEAMPSISDDVLETLERRSYWSYFGL